MKTKDVEYLLVNTEGLEEVIFSASKLKEIAKFCHKDYGEIRSLRSRGNIFKFENNKVQIISVDLNADYEENKNG